MLRRAWVRARGMGTSYCRREFCAEPRKDSARDGIHQPGDAEANQHEQHEGPQCISNAARARALRQAGQRQRNQQREQQHRAKVVKPERTIDQ